MRTEEKANELLSDPVLIPEEQEIKATTPWQDTYRQLKKNNFAIAGFIIILFFILLGLFAPLLTPYGYEEQVLVDRLKPPSSDHWLGTDDVGRDIFTRIAYGARISLQVGFFAVSGALVFGTLLGIIAGYFGHCRSYWHHGRPARKQTEAPCRCKRQRADHAGPRWLPRSF